MRIEVVTEGGFAALPGLQRPVVLDCAALPAGQAAQCDTLVRELAADTAVRVAPAAMRDGRRYTLKIDDGGRTRTFTASDMAMSEAFRSLLALVRASGSAAPA